MTDATSQEKGRSRFRRLLLPLAVLLLPILVFLVILLNTTAEALSPEEILAKKKWNDDELTTALARSMSPAMTGQQKKEVMKHLSAQMKKRTAAQQEEIRVKAVVAAVTASLDQVRKMPEQERQKMFTTIRKRAERSYATIQNNPKQRKEFEKQLKTREMEAFTKEVNRVIFSELTPAERIQFAPVTRIWIKTMKSVGR